MQLSAVDVAIFVVAAGVIMAYHAWFFLSTTVRADQDAATEAARQARKPLEAALARGEVVLLEDYRKAHPPAAASPPEGEGEGD